jgi:folate-binding protein YgfZ
MDVDAYDRVRSGGVGFIEMPRGLIAVRGKEAVQFLDGMITGDMKTLEDGQQMVAAFPNAQGRLLAIVRILREGERFLIETEEATREKVFNNLFRFTYAGDFFVEDLSQDHRYFEFFGTDDNACEGDEGTFRFRAPRSSGVFAESNSAAAFREDALSRGVVVISEEVYETMRIESGTPKFGVDMDETTIVPEIELPEMISYTKGCYIGQEIIARIHFRGHVAKKLTGLIIDERLPITGGRPTIPSPELAGSPQ